MRTIFTIRTVKIVLGVALILVGLLFEIDVYRKLSEYGVSPLSDTTSPKIQGGELTADDFNPNYHPTYEVIAVHNYHHFLFGLSMVAGQFFCLK